ncbi:MAG: 50S ribosomal protein L10, partial [bacterium]
MEQVREYRPEKVAAVATLSEKFSTAKSVFLTDYSGLSVADISELRKRFRETKTEYFVVKNTLARLGAKEAGKESILPYLDGPIALAISYEDPASPARVLMDFLKKYPKPEIKACLIDGEVFI